VKDANAVLVVEVGLGLVFVDRDRPAGSLGDDRLGIPVRTFDEADGDRHAARGRPLGERREIGCAIAQVGLQHDPRVQFLELRLGQELTKQSVRQLLRLVTLQVEPDLSPTFGRHREDRAQVALHGLEAGGIGEGCEIGSKGARFDRHRHAGKLTDVVSFEQLTWRPALAGVEKGVDEPAQAHRIGLGLGVRERVLAEQVDRGGRAVSPQLAESGRCLLRVSADDELLCHPRDLAAGHQARRPPA
jgi:hypothetical protein